MWRRVEAEGLPEGFWGKESSPRTLPFLEPSLLPAGGSPGSAAPAKAGNRAMSALAATTLPDPPCGAAGQDGAAARSILGDVVRPLDRSKWRRGPMALERKRAQR